MARIVVAGAGVVGASIAYHLALRGARDVVLADSGIVAGGATGKAMGGVRQQFTTEAEVRLAQASVRFFASLGEPLFEQVGYLFLATTDAGWEEVRARAAAQRELGVPVDEARIPEGVRADDVVGAVACLEDGIADPAGVTRELVRRAAELGVDVRERTDALGLDGDMLVVACGAASPAVVATRGIELPIRPLVRQLVDVGPVDGIPRALPMTIEAESGFHFRRVGTDVLRLAMPESRARWDQAETVDDALVADWRRRLAQRYPAGAGAPIVRAWAGLYDITPDAHPIIGPVADGVYVACGFSGHGFMQAPAVGAAVAAELLGDEPEVDLAPYRLERFAGGVDLPETLVL